MRPTRLPLTLALTAALSSLAPLPSWGAGDAQAIAGTAVPHYHSGVILPEARPALPPAPSAAPSPIPGSAPAPASFSALPALLAQARRLLDAGQPEAAWQLLEPLTWDYAGARDFDYLLGVAALDSHRPGEAVIALERVLDDNPDDIAARTEIVRAYLALDERPAAQQALQQLVATANLPDEATQSIRRYLDILARRSSQQPRRWQLGLDLGTGFDTNANVGSSHSRWLIDDGTVLTPLPASQPRHSPYAEAQVSLGYLHPLADGVEWSTSLLASQRINSRAHNQDLGSLGLSSGLALTHQAHRFSAAANLQQMLLEGHRFRQAAGLIGQWQYQHDERTQAGLYVQHFFLRFHGQPLRDARRTVGGLSLAHALDDAASTVLLANPYGGREYSRHHLPGLDFELAGLRLGWQRNLGEHWRASLGLQYEQRRYDGMDPLFGQVRHDRQLDLRLGVDYSLTARWTLAPLLQYTRNHATLAPSDFRRTQLQLNVQYRY